MKNTQVHPLAKSMGYSSNEDFYADFPTQEAYNSYMQRGGQINVQQNQAMPEDRTVKNDFRNTMETRREGYKRPDQIPMNYMNSGFGDVPNTLKRGGHPTGGPGTPNNNYTNAGGIYSYQTGGYTHVYAPQPPQGIYGNYTQAQINDEMGKTWRRQNMPQQTQEQEFAGFGNPMSDVNYRAPMPQQQGNTQQSAPMMAATENKSSFYEPGQSDYSIDSARKDEGFMRKGGIHIKPENRGKFTAYKKRTGKTTEEALHSKDPHVRQMANFARNAAHFKHQSGGNVNPYTMQDGGSRIPLTNEIYYAPMTDSNNIQKQEYYNPYSQNNFNDQIPIPSNVRQRNLPFIAPANMQRMNTNSKTPFDIPNNFNINRNNLPFSIPTSHQDGGEIVPEQYMYNTGGYQEGGLYHNQTNPNYGTWEPFGVRVAQEGGWQGAPLPTANNLRGQEYGCDLDMNYQVGGLYHNQNNPNYGTWEPFGVRVAKYGGYLPLAQWGKVVPNPSIVPPTPTPQLPPNQINPDPTQIDPQNVDNPKPNVSPTSPTNDPQFNFNAPANTSGYQQDSTNQRQQSKLPAYVNAGRDLLGAAVLAATRRNSRNDAQHYAGAARGAGMTGSQYPGVQGSKGNYGEVGQGYGQNLSHFGAGNVGSFYQPIAQQGGNPGMLTAYQSGGEYDIPDHEIARLQKAGYKIAFL